MNSSRPLLYTYRRCPYAMRARMALLLAHVEFDAHEIVLRDKPSALLAVSPKGTVPVLVLPNGRVLEQSWDIVEWALTHEGANTEVQDWWRRAQTPENLDLLHRNDGDFKFHLDRYKYPERFWEEAETSVGPERQIVHRDQAVAILLNPLEHRLVDRAFLGGAQPSAADFCIFPFVRQFAAVDPKWVDALPLEHVKRWLSHWLQGALFEACMTKLPSNTLVQYPMRTF